MRYGLTHFSFEGAQIFQSDDFLFHPLEFFGLVKLEPAIFLAMAIVGLLAVAGIVTSCVDRLAVIGLYVPYAIPRLVD